MTATVEIETVLNGSITVLKKAYHTTPFKIADITEDKKSKQLQLMLMSSSPGILDADRYNIKIAVDKNCSLRLHSQSYQRLFTMKETATQQMDVHLSGNASFCYIPHPIVPHKRSSFMATNRFYLSTGCSLLFGEILTCGRKLNGEIFLFTKYHTITEIFLNNKLIIKENLLITPSTINVTAIGQLENYTHQASLVYLNENADIKELIEMIGGHLSLQNEIDFGITASPANGLIIRILGQKAELLFDCLNNIANSLEQANMSKTF